MDSQTRNDLEQVQGILDQRIYELTHGDDYAFRTDPSPKLKSNFWKRLPLTVLLMATRGFLFAGRTTKRTNTRPPQALRV